MVTYRSPDGSFGGPVRVAEAQALALEARGHSVTILAGAPNRRSSEIADRVRVEEFAARRLAPGRGFAFLCAPGLLPWLDRHRTDFDIVHIHMARDLVTLPVAMWAQARGIPYVAQTHGMIDQSERRLAQVLDFVATRRALRRAHEVFVLTPAEALQVVEVESTIRTAPIVNGLAIPRDAVVSGPRPPVVLFLARLHPRKRPVAFVEMATAVAAADPNARFVLAGPDEGELHAVNEALAASDIRDRFEIVGAIDPGQTNALMASSAVYVLPSEGEVFPMSVLEALQQRTPVVTTASIGMAALLRRHGAAALTDGTPAELAKAVLKILGSEDEAERYRSGGRRLLLAELDIANVARDLEAHYQSAPRVDDAGSNYNGAT